MTKLVVIGVLAAAFLTTTGCGSIKASTANEKFSPDFAKAGLKALIAVENGVHYGETELDRVHIQSLVDEAQAAAGKESDKAALRLIQQFQERLKIGALDYRVRVLEAGAKRIQHGEPREFAEADAVTDANEDHRTLRDQKVAKACSDSIENILRSGTLAPATACDVSIPPTTK